MRNVSLVFKALALAAAASLAACGGGSSGSSGSIPPAPSGNTVLNNIVGIGDSLTAGEQAGGVLGDTTLPDPFFPGITVPATQESGWWSQFYMSATGSTYVAMANPATSVLPLIGKPGLGNQLIPNNSTVTHVPLPFLPLSQAITGHGCDSFNKAAYALSTYSATLMNPAGHPKDLGIPGITLHEAAAMYQPPSPSCAPIPNAPPTILGLQALLSESEFVYPVLGSFNGFLQPATQLSAALSLKPTLTTVFLGPNDVLHFAFSGGAFTGSDNAQQAQADMTNIITSLQKAGSAVVVANVPNVLEEPFYFSIATPPAPQACQLQNFMICDLEQLGVPAANAAAITAGIAAKYGLGPNGYLTLQGFLAEVTANPQFSADLNALAGGNGLGSMYVTPAFAASIQTENDAINTGIAAAAQATGVPLVDLRTVNHDIATGNVQDPVAAQALTINPGKCCSLAFGGGMQSFDGLHPSNTGYAFIADGFIQAIDAKYGTSIPPINPAAVYNGTGAIPFPDPYAQH